MKRTLALGLILTGLATSAQADGWTMMPFRDANWSPDFTLSVNAGPMDFDVRGVDTDTAIGLQLSLNCPWFSPPAGLIRQQFNYNVYDEKGVKVSTFEMNPHWYTGEGDLRFGFGPGIGYLWVDPDQGADDSLWAAQLGANIEYRQGVLFLGLGTRYQVTEGGRADNLLTQAKIGVNF